MYNVIFMDLPHSKYSTRLCIINKTSWQALEMVTEPHTQTTELLIEKKNENR